MAGEPSNNFTDATLEGRCSDCKEMAEFGETATDTNQASEDDDIFLRRILFKWAEKFNEMGEPSEGQDGWYITYDKYMDMFTEEAQSFIRTEKLKLLDEVRERVVGGDEPGITNIMIAAEHAEQNKALNKLEAEL